MRLFNSSKFALAIMILLGLSIAAPAAAKPPQKPAPTTNQSTYRVKSGDSLARIAKKTGVSVAELQQLNQLTSTALKPGQTLLLAATAPKATAKNSTSTAKQAATAIANTPSHQVKKGESLYQIARKHRLSVANLQAWNGLSGTALKPGQSLRLAPPPSESVVARAETPSANEGLTGPTHTVTKGETLYQIARKSGVSVAELARLNRLQNNRIHPGQTLSLGAEAKLAPPAEGVSSVADVQGEPGVETAGSAAPDSGSLGPVVREQASVALETGEAPNPERLAQTINKLRNLPYRFGGNGVSGIDCSGFVQRVFREFAIELPRSAREQYQLGVPVERNLLQEGDLLFFRTYAKYPSHVGIYLGNNKMVHASTRSRKVVISDITQGYYKKRYIGAKRLGTEAGDGLNIEAVKDLLQEESDEDDKPAGMTSRGPSPGRRVQSPG